MDIAFLAISQIIARYTTLLNHPRGWDGKPKGLPETAGSPKYLNEMATRFFVAGRCAETRNARERGKYMKARYPRTASRIATISSLALALTALCTAPVSAEALSLFRGPELLSAAPNNTLPPQQDFRMKFDDKGDLLIQCGCARITVAYNSPSDQLRPIERQRNPQRDESAAINGISVVASISF